VNLSTLRPKTQLALAVLVPVACLALGAILLWPCTTSLRQTNDELKQTQGTIQQKKAMISQAEVMAQGRSLALAVALPTEEEPIAFLRQFAALTAESGTVLASVKSMTPPPVSQPNASGGAAAAPAQQTASAAPGSSAGVNVGQGQRPVTPPAVRELTNEVHVEGKYNDVLALIVRLENYERILSVSRCHISLGSQRDYPRLQAVFTVSRFVAAPEAPVATKTASAAQPSTGAR
jgi:hypothetical protein